MTRPVWIVGMGMGPEDLTPAHQEAVRSAQVLVGGRRHLAVFESARAERIEIAGSLALLAETIAGKVQEGLRVAVLASGDPLFFGIGRFLAERLGGEKVRVLPNVNSVAAAFARLGRAWDEVPVVSCHGRSGGIHRLLAVLTREPVVTVLTDPVTDPACIARELRARGLDDADLWIMERLGGPDERVRRFAVDQAGQHRFADPNLVVIVQPEPVPAAIGGAEAEFERVNGLITKSEARAVSLALMRIRPDHTVWDLGAGSGSVALEAAVLAWNGRVVAVEKDPERSGLLFRNRRRLRRWHVDLVAARLPEGMDELPDPDRVFVGGGGRDLAAILQKAVPRLPPNGIVVVNCVLLASLETARRVLRDLGVQVDVVQVQVSRGRAVAAELRLEAQNPVWIVRGVRTES
jgi:precorrin-6Y C5,15-methyltransferase (decarboxylating)